MRCAWLLTLLAPYLALMACGDDGNTCIGIGCNDEVGDTGEEPPISKCWPHLPEQVGGADEVGEGEPVEAVVYSCEGTGNGWATIQYHDLGGLISDLACMNTPAEITDPKVEDCLDYPIDLTSIEQPPWVCCTEDIEEPALHRACRFDCAHAACKIAVQKIEEMAAGLDTQGLKPLERFKGDLQAYAEILSLPDQQEECARLVRDAAGDVAEVNLHEAPSEEEDDKDKLGHIENLTLYMQCAVETVEQVPEAGACTQSAHTPDVPEHEDRDGLVFGGAATFKGPHGEGQSDLVDGAIALRVPTCTEQPCTITLTQLDARFENVQVPDLELTRVTAHLRAPAQAWRTGESLVFPAGALRFDVQARVLVDGAPLSKSPGSVLQVTNVQPAVGSFADDGTFTLDEATFAAASYEVVLRLDPSPTSLRTEPQPAI